MKKVQQTSGEATEQPWEEKLGEMAALMISLLWEGTQGPMSVFCVLL